MISKWRLNWNGGRASDNNKLFTVHIYCSNTFHWVVVALIRIINIIVFGTDTKDMASLVSVIFIVAPSGFDDLTLMSK